MSRDETSSLDFDQLAQTIRDNVEIKDRKYRAKIYKNCFVGADACQWMVKVGIASDLEQAECLGNMLIDAGEMHHVLRDHLFKNDFLFYRFKQDEEDHGRKAEVASGEKASWLELLPTSWSEGKSKQLNPSIPTYFDDLAKMTRVDTWGVEPLDKYNAELLDNVHPRDWKDPAPIENYNMVVIGAGSGGLVTAAAAAGVGARVALIEEHLLGGDCLNFGCVPSKALLSAAKAAQHVREAFRFGVRIDGLDEREIREKVYVDFPLVMERLRRLRAEISHHDSAERFAQQLGIDVYIGRASFTAVDTVSVNDKTLSFDKCCIATGGTPAVPPIPGLRDAPFYSNMTLFNLTKLPPRLAVIGAGPIGVEMAQAFQRFGAQVTMITRSEKILPKEDPDAAGIVQRALERDGVKFLFGCKYKQVRHEKPKDSDGFPVITITLEDSEVECDALLVATGRKPNVDSLNLEAADVEYDSTQGVMINDRLQSSNKNIYAVGDVATKYQFTHVADFMARAVVRNALFFGRDNFSDLLIPWCTYTEPEVAHVGLYERDLIERNIAYKKFTQPFSGVDRAILESRNEGFARAYVKEGSDELLGATIVGPNAGDMISELTLAIQSGVGLSKLANVIHPYPTEAEAVRKLGDLYNKTRLTPAIKKVLRGIMSLRR